MASNNQPGLTSPGDWRIPVVVAAVAWFASAIAVIGYTYIAFKETISGEGDPLDANPPGLTTAEAEKQLGIVEKGNPKSKSLRGRLPRLGKLPGGESPHKQIPQWEIKALGEKLGKPSPGAPQHKSGRRKLR